MKWKKQQNNNSNNNNNNNTHTQNELLHNIFISGWESIQYSTQSKSLWIFKNYAELEVNLFKLIGKSFYRIYCNVMVLQLPDRGGGGHKNKKNT